MGTEKVSKFTKYKKNKFISNFSFYLQENMQKIQKKLYVFFLKSLSLAPRCGRQNFTQESPRQGNFFCCQNCSWQEPRKRCGSLDPEEKFSLQTNRVLNSVIKPKSNAKYLRHQTIISTLLHHQRIQLLLDDSLRGVIYFVCN